MHGKILTRRLSWEPSLATRPARHCFAGCIEHIENFLVISVKKFAYALVPQLFRTRFFQDLSSRRKLHETSYLDGLRGVAALGVFNMHFVYVWGDIVDVGWGAPNHRWPLNAPVIRLLFSGLAMVDVFFIVAGYTIAWKPLKLAQKHDLQSRDMLFQTLCSSVFRRAVRLYLPVFTISLIVVCFTQVGAFESLRPAIDAGILYGEKHPFRNATFFGQVTEWFTEMTKLCNIWTWKPIWPHVDSHLWTIPFEFRSSLMLYISILFVARIKHGLKQYAFWLIALYCLYFSRWEVMLYHCGAAFAQVNIVKRSEDSTLLGGNVALDDTCQTDHMSPVLLHSAGIYGYCKKYVHHQHQLSQAAVSCGILIGMWLMSAPNRHYSSALGFMSISKLIPQWFEAKERFIPMSGTVVLMTFLPHASPSSIWQRVLTTSLVQYLAQISFSIYLVHGPLMHSLGYTIPLTIWKYTGKECNLTFFFGIWLGWAISLMLVLWAADVFAREVDGRIVLFAKWLEKVCFQRLK